MLKYVLSLIRGDAFLSGTIPSLDDAYSVVSEPNPAPKEKKLDEHLEEDAVEDYETCNKTGRITKIVNNNYTVDDLYTFRSDLDNLAIGTQISYQLVKSLGIVDVVDVNILDELEVWDSVNTGKRTWCLRTIICAVASREERVLTLKPGDVKVDLDKVSSTFVPVIGDWVELEVKCEVDEYVTDLSGKIIEVNKLRPLRPQIKKGKITQWRAEAATGVIDRNVYFDKAALQCGYIPVEGEEVVAEAIESDQGVCVWRALKIIPSYLHQSGSSGGSSITENHVKDSYPGLKITENISLTFDKLRDSKSFLIDVENVSKSNISLESIVFPRANGQCKLGSEFNGGVLTPDQCLTLKCECTAKYVGESREVILFTIEAVKIKRWVDINVKSFKPPQSGRYQRQTQAPPVDRTRREVVRGVPLKMVARFITLRIPDYFCPQRLITLLENCTDRHQVGQLKEKIVVMKPVLVTALSYTNYEDKFHTLLHLEEINTMMAMRQYDQPRACFIKSGEFLMLEIENLAEKRPSVIIGDRVKARDIVNATNPDYEGFVHRVGKNHVYIKFSPIFHDSYNGEDYTVIVEHSRTTYKREHFAVSLAVKHLGKDVLFPTKVAEKEPQVQFVFDHYVDSFSSPEKLASPESKPKSISKQGVLATIRKFQLSTDQEVTVLKLEWHNQSLNYYQKEAVRNILLGVCRPLPYLVFGPPGTGKTVTLVEAILQILRLMPHSRILVAAPSNSATDLLAMRLIDSGVLRPGDLVRLAAMSAINSIPAKLTPYCATANPEREGTVTEGPVVMSNGLTLGCNSSALGRHRITVTTCNSAGTLYAMGFPKGHFTHIVVDEAGQTSEPSVMIPLAFLDVHTGQAILAGDPMQLGPVILSSLASQYGLEESYLERMINRFPYVRDPEGFPKSCGYDPRLITKLVYNYRSLPVLLKLPSLLFYNDDLLPTISETESAEALFLNTLKDVIPISSKGGPSSIVFHGVVGDNYQTEDSPSWLNPHEASQVFYYVNELYRMGLTSTDIGLITPYKAQAKQLVTLFQEAEFSIPKIGTVEDFQGQEFNVVILSTVRSYEKYVEKDVLQKLGFVASPRRLNVSISRAKTLLIIVGNPHLLSGDRYWRSVIDYCFKNGSYVGCPFRLA